MPEFNSIESSDGNVDIPRRLKYKLYINRALSAWADRMWQFAIGLYFIKLYPDSFLLSAIHGVVSSLIVFVAAPMVGRWIEGTSRMREVTFSLFLQNGSVAFGAICVAVFEFEMIKDQQLNRWILSTGLIICAIIGQIWSIGYTTSLEKDWVLCIANNEKQLTELNAVIRRIDLFCVVAAPSLVGVIMDLSLTWSAVFLTVWNIISAIIEYSILVSIYASVPKLKDPKKFDKKKKLNLIDLKAFNLYGKLFFLPGLSFSLLYLTVLGFDTTALAYASQFVKVSILGFLSVGSGLVGIIGTLFYPMLVKKFGVKTSAFIGFLCEMICLTLCLGDAAKSLLNIESIGIILLLAGMISARFGLWIADLGVNQLIQTETSSPSLISSVQTSVNILMELIKFIIVLFVNEVSQFYILILLSFASQLLGTVLFAIYTFQSGSCFKTREYAIND